MTTNPSPIPNFNVPLVDPKTGLITSTWMRYFLERVGGIGPNPNAGIAGPVSSTVGDILTWANTSGTQAADSGVSFPIPAAQLASIPASQIIGTLATSIGGTGLNGSSAADGYLLIGNGSGFSLAPITPGSGISIANSAGGIKISLSANTNFSTFSYTGTGSNQSIALCAFQPDLVTVFGEGLGSPNSWATFDSTNGVQVLNSLSNTNKYVSDSGSLLSFDPAGFSVGTSSAVNHIGTTFQGFCWKKGTGILDVQNYTGTGSNATIAHSLGIVPQMMFVYDAHSQKTVLYHAHMDSSTPADFYDSWGASAITTVSDSTVWQNTAPTSSNFYVGSNLQVNFSGSQCTAYLFGAIAGQSAFGSYTGNGSTTGPVVALGFRPSLVMICQQSASANNCYFIWGNTASGVINLNNSFVTTNYVNLTGTGFQVVTTNADFNTNSTVYLYSAWA